MKAIVDAMKPRTVPPNFYIPMFATMKPNVPPVHRTNGEMSTYIRNPPTGRSTGAERHYERHAPAGHSARQHHHRPYFASNAIWANSAAVNIWRNGLC